MTIEIRPAEPDEMGQLGSLGGYVYGGSFGDGPDSLVATAHRPEWTLCAFEGPKMVASYVTLPLTMRSNNGTATPLGGVSAVGTLPEYRRRGLVRRLVTQSFEDMYQGGRPVASLWASLAGIYQRYGYSRATGMQRYAIDTVDIAFHDGDVGSSEVERLGVDDGYPLAKEVYAAYVADRMCYLHRSRALWDNNALDARAEDGPVEVAVARNDAGEPVGYVIYTLRHSRVDHVARTQEIVIRDLAWLTLDAYRSLWTFLSRHDLVGRVRWDSAPLDDPAPELLMEPRLLHEQTGEGTWLRVVHVEEALARRGYDGDGELVIEVLDDGLAPWNPGRYALAVGDDGQVEVNAAPGRPADVTTTVKALSSLYSGFHSARQLGAWGMIEAEPGALVRADRLFATRHRPGCPDHF